MASEFDDESIVIDQSSRDNFAKFLRKIANTIFTQVLNFWASKLHIHREGNVDPFFSNGCSTQTLDLFARSILSATNSWRKVDLKSEEVQDLAYNNQAVI